MARGDRIAFDLDPEDIRLFCEEAAEHLETLDSSLVRLEAGADELLLQQIFRAAHTLKGSSATIGHSRMASLTHAMESTLDAFRQGTAEPSQESIDVLLVALDLLRDLAAEVETGVESGAEPAIIEARLRLLTEAGREPGALASYTSLEAPEEDTAPVADEGSVPVRITIAISEECLLPSIRCYQVLQELDAQGVVTEIAPSRDVIESGGADRHLTVTLLTTMPPAELQAAIFAVSDVASVELDGPAAPLDFAATHGTGTGKSAAAPSVDESHGLAAIPIPVAASSRAVQSIRIDVERLDGLMNLIGELVIDHTRLQQIRGQLSHVLKDAHLAQLAENFEETTAHLGRVTEELQEQIMRSRMLPIRSVLTRLPRLVRDVAQKCGKRVELVMSGEETELDRSVIEEISDPLVHILRNAIDHGIETPEERLAAGKPESGTVTITAWSQETYIFVSIADDGRGIDANAVRRKAVERGLVTADAAAAANDDTALQYIFFAGLSTATVISDISGRGVGMDVVRANIERLHGKVQLRSTPGKGSEITLQLPLTLATTKALLVRADGTTYAIPLVTVTEALNGATADISRPGGRPTLRLRNQLIPVVDLGRALGEPGGDSVQTAGDSSSSPIMAIARRASWWMTSSASRTWW
jgi:two-component system chemotaxis sensor kinase CheA